MSEQDSQVHISMDKKLFDKVEQRLQYTSFDSVGDYVNFIIDQIIHNVEDEIDEDNLDNVDDEVEARLRSLGYLDN